MKKQERILTQDELEIVLSQAQDYGRYLELENILFMHTDWKDIVWVTPINKLAFIWGNEDTGFLHINKRHLFYQNLKFWKENGKPDDPSLFKRNTIPRGDYMNIADDVFSKGVKNKKGEREGFDNYTGLFKHRDGDEHEYILVTYKDTKIVHTLYPTKKIGNQVRPKDFLWHRGDVTGTLTFPEGESRLEIVIPYVDSDNIKCYSALFEFINNKAYLRLQVHNPKEKQTGTTQPILEWDVTADTGFESMGRYFQHADLELVEQHILRFHRQVQKEKA